MNEAINPLDIAGVEVIKEHFSLTPLQVQQFTALGELYRDWNAKINVISRKDIDNLYPHHIIHSLAIAKVLHFQSGTTLLDVGTGGGFPGIPLAILFPECQFTLIDSIGKKIKVASEIANAIGLSNVTCIQERAEMEKGKFDFVISRAVMPLGDLVKLIRKNVSHQHQNAMPNGLMVLKGGNLDGETQPFRKYVELTDISQIFTGEWYKEKSVVYLPL
jgi:16S rRNA (guanine527-N7)-methyltransferase